MEKSKYFGLHRVMEPKGTVPVTAWKMDNSRRLCDGEVCIRLEKVHIAWDSFSQICSYCGFDVRKVKARILQIVEERGKLHNPYTGSGGLLTGVIEEVAQDVDLQGLTVGDRVICLTSLGAIAMHIDEINDVDFNYGQITCTGYAIVFAASSVVRDYEEVNLKHLLCAIDESGNYVGIRRAVATLHARRVVVIGSYPLTTTLLYIQMLKENCGENAYIDLILDKGATGSLTEAEISAFFTSEVRKTCFVNLSQPMEALRIFAETCGMAMPVDAVINLEDIVGTETLATFIVREQGMVFYTSLKNTYSMGIILTEALGKEVNAYALDGYTKDAHGTAITLVDKMKDKLDALDRLFAMQKEKRSGERADGQKENSATAAERIDDFVYESPVTGAMVEEALNVAQYDCNVIIQGETGVGKEKVLQLIYQNSPRHGKPCIKINCATIQENLAESEFFGYEKGAFTGAQAGGKAGYFELANNGTLFLDEIGALSLSMQTKLLRVLQENTYYRVGGTEQKHVNVRVICANNVPLQKLISEGKFREDLYYRLNICCIDVPPLRERTEDIHCLADAFLKNYSKKYGMAKEFSPEAMVRLEAYHWPGNVRELENVVHRLYINARTGVIDEETVSHMLGNAAYAEMILNIRREVGQSDTIDFCRIIEEQEKRMIAYALKREGTTRKAAEFLHLPQATLARKKRRYGL